jgi:hypothetical protein
MGDGEWGIESVSIGWIRQGCTPPGCQCLFNDAVGGADTLHPWLPIFHPSGVFAVISQHVWRVFAPHIVYFQFSPRSGAMFVAMGEAYSRHPWCGTQNNRTPEGCNPMALSTMPHCCTPPGCQCLFNDTVGGANTRNPRLPIFHPSGVFAVIPQHVWHILAPYIVYYQFSPRSGAMFVAMGEAYSRHSWCGTQNNRTPEGCKPMALSTMPHCCTPPRCRCFFSTISHGWREYVSPMATNISPLRGVRSANKKDPGRKSGVFPICRTVPICEPCDANQAPQHPTSTTPPSTAPGQSHNYTMCRPQDY